MQICRGQVTDPITVGGRIDDVVWFTYFGSVLTCEVNCRIGKVASAFQHNMTNNYDIVFDQCY